MVELSILKTNIRINFLFVAMLSLLSLTDKSGCVFLSVLFSLLHEMGHIAAMEICKERIESLTFHPFGIAMRLSTGSALSFGQEFFVLISGCAVNLIFALLFTGSNTAYINIGMLTFNMLPVANLDGGRILRLFLTRLFGERAGNMASNAVSFVVLVPLSALAFYTVTRTRQFSLVVCCIYLVIITVFKRDKLA